MKWADFPFSFRLVAVIVLALLAINLFFFLGPMMALMKVADSLREWQILIASMVAFAAAVIAYKAAMAKVMLDREIADREVLRKKLSLYLKLEFALQVLGSEASVVVNSTEWIFNRNKSVTVEELKIAEPQEIGEAWNYLDVFPMQTIKELRIIRATLRKCAITLNGHPPGTKWTVEIGVMKNYPVQVINNFAKEIRNACKAAVEQLSTAVQAITMS